MRSASSGSPSVRSQESVRDEDVAQDRTPISQAQFATQIPISKDSLECKGTASDALHSLRTGVDLLGQNVPDTAAMNALFKRRPDQPPQSAQIDITLHVDPVVAAVTDTVGTPVSWPAGVVDVDSQGSDQDEDEEELSQAEIQGHIQEEIVSSAGQAITNNSQAVQGIKIVDSVDLPLMPAAMLEIMRTFRRESLNGRYLPRRLQRVPAAQKALIEATESWQPPLVGKSERPGSVPQELLSALIERADRIVPTSVELDTNNQKVDQAENSDILSQRRDSDKPITTSHEQQSTTSSPASSDGSAESESSAIWSSSPPRRHPQLPPDSPIKPRDQTTPYGQAHTSDKAVQSSVQSSPASSSMNTESKSLSEARRGGQDVPRTQELRSNKSSRLPSEPLSSTTIEVSTRKKPSTRPQTQTKNDNLVRNSVKVHRTPYPPLRPETSPLPVRSSVAHLTVVPGTFDDKRKPDELITKTASQISANAMQSDDMMEFEANSSEDEGQAFDGARGPSSAYPSEIRAGTNNHAISTVKSAERRTTTPSIRSRKRQYEALASGSAQERLKRNRTLVSRIEGGQEAGNSYSVVDDLRRQSRRMFHQALQQKRHETDQIHSSTDHEFMQRDSAGSASPILPTVSSRLPSVALAIDGASNLDARSSVYATVTSNHSKQPMSKRVVDNTQAKSLTSTDLFAEFQRAYPDYQGQRQHFMAACQLLKTLRDRSKATHPSLWDDFVFRHFHDYRAHLQEVMESSGNAMSYEAFYETCVEEPTHHKRIIRSAHLDMPPPLSGFITPRSSIGNNHIGVAVSLGHMRTELVPSSATSSKRKAKPTVEETCMEEVVTSQESTQSVHLWLERAAGAESPELGTPKVSVKHNSNVPPLDLQHLEPKSLSRSKDKVVSRPSPLVNGRSSNLEPRSTGRLDIPTPMSNSQLSKLKDASHKPVSSPTTLPKKITTSSTETHITTSPLSQQPKPKANPPSTSQARTSPSNPKPSSTTKPTFPKPSTVTSPQEVDTVFKRFMRDYNALSCEKNASIDDTTYPLFSLDWTYR